MQVNYDPIANRALRPVVVYDAEGRPVDTRLHTMGYQRVAVPTSGVTPLPAAPAGATMAQISIEGAGIRYRDDGVDPSADSGMPLDAGESLTYDAAMGDFRMIGRAAGAFCNVTFYGPQP